MIAKVIRTCSPHAAHFVQVHHESRATVDFYIRTNCIKKYIFLQHVHLFKIYLIRFF